MKRTPLFSAHRRAGAKMVAFAGWEMPVQYQGVIDEHLAVRSRAGLFDVSHMGEIEVRGKGATEFCQSITANDISRMKIFQAQYNLLLNERGGVTDDVIFYRLAPDEYFICVNASNSDKDFAAIEARAAGQVEVANVSSEYAQLALQGPRAEKILQSLTESSMAELKSFAFQFANVAGVRCLAARTGYTGEDGFELYCRSAQASQLWFALLEAGAADGLVPAGLGARDTLRLEMAFPLYGHELDETTTPLEAGLAWVVKLSKGDFLGRSVLLQQKEHGLERKLVGLEMLEPGIARGGYPLFKNRVGIGRITSGTKSPSLGKAIALGYVAAAEAALGNIVNVEIRGRKIPAKIVSLPFYRRKAQAEA
jgi:glycine cleavage system T protein (aminomethyltransferase)